MGMLCVRTRGRKLKVYVETSVISAYHRATASISRNTRLFFKKVKAEKLELFTSVVTLEELDRTPSKVKRQLLALVDEYGMKILARTDSAINLARIYVERGMIPGKFKPDAEHIAIASVNSIDVIVSWNLEHIVKLKTKLMVKQINKEQGYAVPDIVRPDEVL